MLGRLVGRVDNGALNDASLYLIADIPRNLTLPTSATQRSAIYRKVKRLNCMPQTELDG